MTRDYRARSPLDVQGSALRSSRDLSTRLTGAEKSATAQAEAVLPGDIRGGKTLTRTCVTGSNRWLHGLGKAVTRLVQTSGTTLTSWSSDPQYITVEMPSASAITLWVA
jgi:hypothetical protein